MFRKMPRGTVNEVSIVKAKVKYTIVKAFRTNNKQINYTFIIMRVVTQICFKLLQRNA